MLEEDYLDTALGLMIFCFGWGIFAYLFLFTNGSSDSLGLAVSASGFISPTYNIEPHGIWRLLVGILCLIGSLCCGSLSVYSIYLYIKDKKAN